MTCPLCAEIQKKTAVVYEDALCVVLLHPQPSVKGHMVVAPKEHYPILEQTPDTVVQHTFFVANKASVIAFEGLKVPGTNIIVNNGVPSGQQYPHFSINVLPRTENDALDFNFERKQAKTEDLKVVQSTLKDCTDLIGHTTPVEVVDELGEIEHVSEQEGEENYLLKQLERIP